MAETDAIALLDDASLRECKTGARSVEPWSCLAADSSMTISEQCRAGNGHLERVLLAQLACKGLQQRALARTCVAARKLGATDALDHHAL